MLYGDSLSVAVLQGVRSDPAPAVIPSPGQCRQMLKINVINAREWANSVVS